MFHTYRHTPHSLLSYVCKLLSHKVVNVDFSKTCEKFGQLAGACECGNELSGSIKCGEFLDYPRTGWLLKKDSAPWSVYENLENSSSLQ